MIFLSPLLMWMYVFVLAVLCLYGLHRYWILYLYWKHRDAVPAPPSVPPAAQKPRITVQLPIYNEIYVLPRLIKSVCALRYPRGLLEIQILDDSTDESQRLAQELAKEAKRQGHDVRYLRRPARSGFKAGALSWGLTQASGEFIAIFDADFTPEPDFLERTLPYFQDPKMGMVQVRWGHLNAAYSLLTRLQSVFLDGHFMLEHTARNRSGAFFNFNGTAGIWRKEAIES